MRLPAEFDFIGKFANPEQLLQYMYRKLSNIRRT